MCTWLVSFGKDYTAMHGVQNNEIRWEMNIGYRFAHRSLFWATEGRHINRRPQHILCTMYRNDWIMNDKTRYMVMSGDETAAARSDIMETDSSSVWIRKTNWMSLFVLFISLLIVAQHVSGKHVPIIRSWRLRDVIASWWYVPWLQGRLSRPVDR